MLHSWDLVKRSEIKWSGLGITFENAVLHAVVLHFFINALIARFQSFNKVSFQYEGSQVGHWVSLKQPIQLVEGLNELTLLSEIVGLQVFEFSFLEVDFYLSGLCKKSI